MSSKFRSYLNVDSHVLLTISISQFLLLDFYLCLQPLSLPPCTSDLVLDVRHYDVIVVVLMSAERRYSSRGRWVARRKR